MSAPREVPMESYRVPDFQGLPHCVTIPKRYAVENCLGSGSGGIVCKARDAETGRDVAVKSVTSHMAHPRGALKVLREIRVMRHLMQCESIVTLHEAFRCGDWNSSNAYVCLVMELMETDLEQVIRGGQIEEDNAQFFTYQMILGLRYMHQCGIIHRDLKPGNILVNADCTLKIADFGSARDEKDQLTAYVVTRWYRAPELLMSIAYNKKVDMFAAGCILGQMLKSMVLKSAGQLPSPEKDPRRVATVLFPGAHYLEQMKMIMNFLGFPSAQDLNAIPSTAAQNYILKMKPDITSSCDFHKAFPNIPDEALSLLRWLLQFSPERRCTAEEALKHPWLEEYAEEEQPLPPYNASYEQLTNLTDILELLDKELVIYKALPSSIENVGLSSSDTTGSNTASTLTATTDAADVEPVSHGASMQTSLYSAGAQDSPVTTGSSGGGSSGPRGPPGTSPVAHSISLDGEQLSSRDASMGEDSP